MRNALPCGDPSDEGLPYIGSRHFVNLTASARAVFDEVKVVLLRFLDNLAHRDVIAREKCVPDEHRKAAEPGDGPR
jgi:hypothetical protein